MSHRNAGLLSAALTGLLVAGAAAGVTLAQAPAAQQQPPPMAGVIFKNKAPVSEAVLSIKLPRPQEADLPNGLHVMVLEDRRAPQVTIQLSMRGAGGYYDPADHAGLAQFTAANMRESAIEPSS